MIDTHLHIWNFSKAKYPWLDGNETILNRTYLIEEIEEERKAAGITSAVLVQASNNLEDTDWMLENAASVEWVAGVVGWLPLQDPVQVASLLANKYGANQYFKGVRHLIHDEADPNWLLQPTVLESLQILADHGIPYDVVGVLTAHIETVLKVAEKVPGLNMIFDHLNQPPILSKQQFGRWGELMQEAARNERFYAKISGLGTASGDPANWTGADLKPYIAFIIQEFGIDRCFCGGDWPVSLLAGSYSKTWSVYQQLIKELVDPSAQEKIFDLNASKFYHL